MKVIAPGEKKGRKRSRGGQNVKWQEKFPLMEIAPADKLRAELILVPADSSTPSTEEPDEVSRPSRSRLPS
jgi:hypothetical protein